MKKISMQEFLVWQPGFPNQSTTDIYYVGVANKLLEIIDGRQELKEMPEALKRRLALCLTGYFQDIIADAGIWRSFTAANYELHGKPLPFFKVDDSYVDYELNRDDVRFLVWYCIAMVWENKRDLYPLSSLVSSTADACFKLLDFLYEDAPMPENFDFAYNLDANDPDDREAIYHLGQWLYLHCYLMTPAFALSMNEIAADSDVADGKDITTLHKRLEEAMTELPTGPLALYLPEWIHLILEQQLPPLQTDSEATETHKYYEPFIKSTNGARIAYFRTYEEMNEFFITSLNWQKGVEHLAQLKGSHDYIAMVNPKRGLLVARNVARCIADPNNPLYDQTYAREHAFEMLTVRGYCPADLTRWACENKYLPDAVFPGTDDRTTVATDWDFIARCYLQLYYRD